MSKKLMIGLLCCGLLQACAGARMSQELQQGKMSFKSGDYANAFHQLLPLASEGNADAEYAVGYMYYYGYGVARDNESGIFWMKKAAAQNQKAAIKALALIH